MHRPDQSVGAGAAIDRPRSAEILPRIVRKLRPATIAEAFYDMATAPTSIPPQVIKEDTRSTLPFVCDHPGCGKHFQSRGALQTHQVWVVPCINLHLCLLHLCAIRVGTSGNQRMASDQDRLLADDQVLRRPQRHQATLGNHQPFRALVRAVNRTIRPQQLKSSKMPPVPMYLWICLVRCDCM